MNPSEITYLQSVLDYMEKREMGGKAAEQFFELACSAFAKEADGSFDPYGALYSLTSAMAQLAQRIHHSGLYGAELDQLHEHYEELAYLYLLIHETYRLLKSEEP